MKIVFTKEFKAKLKAIRKVLVIIFNLLKYVSLISGVIISIICVCGLDAEGIYGDNALLGLFIGCGLIALSVLTEIFVVRCLVRDNEYVNTIFDFEFYGPRSINTRDNYFNSIIYNDIK